jgi:hypothetical protein
MTGRMWTLKNAQEAIQTWYDELRKAYNENDWKRIGELYNEDSLVYARISGKTAKGKSKIKGYWKDLIKPKKGTWTRTEPVVLTLIPTDRLVRDGLAFERIMQLVHWKAVLIFQKAASITDVGYGGHIEECVFNNPDYQDMTI